MAKKTGTGAASGGRGDILTYYPYPTFRVGHREALQTLSDMWKNFDVALVISPMGSGKTALRRALAYWAGDAAMLVPTNALILQELSEFPDTNKILNRADFYKCDHCYNIDLANARRRGQPVLCVPHMLVAQRLGRRTLIVDEGHKLLPVNQDLQSIHAWRRDVRYPPTTYTREQFEQYLQLNPAVKNRDKLLAKLRTNDYMVKREMAGWRNAQLDRLRLIPLSPELHRSLSAGSERIILLSATLSDEDVYDLGVSRNKRILKLELPSPIPAENRPLVREYVGSLSYGNLPSMAPMLARRIMDIANFHAGEKGIVHITYGLAKILRSYLPGERFMWHTDIDSKTQLAAWMETGDKILMAAGMGEGLDLKGPEFAWQIIAKIAWPSLSDVAIRKKAEGSQSWYTWQALKALLQAYGRICRGPTDIGVTYILDSSMERLTAQARKYGLLPKYFLDVL